MGYRSLIAKPDSLCARLNGTYCARRAYVSACLGACVRSRMHACVSVCVHGGVHAVVCVACVRHGQTDWLFYNTGRITNRAPVCIIHLELICRN